MNKGHGPPDVPHARQTEPKTGFKDAAPFAHGGAGTAVPLKGLIRRRFLFRALLCCTVATRAQPALPQVYALTDAHALCIPADTQLSRLTQRLTAPFGSDSQKVRAIFRWITANIAYDLEAFHRGGDGGLFKQCCAGTSSAAAADSLYTRAVAAAVLKNGKGVCDGYSRLFKTMCAGAGVPCAIITGCARNYATPINGLVYNSNHAWNAVEVGGQWRLLDVTWASGYTNEGVTRFTRRFNEIYFFSPPRFFAYAHYPDERDWLLMDPPPSRAAFLEAPARYPALWGQRVQAVEPAGGVLRLGPDRLIRFRITAADTVREAHVSLDPGTQSVHFSIGTEAADLAVVPAGRSRAPGHAGGTAKPTAQSNPPSPGLRHATDAILDFLETVETEPDTVASGRQAAEPAPAFPPYNFAGTTAAFHYALPEGAVCKHLYIFCNGEAVLRYELAP